MVYELKRGSPQARARTRGGERFKDKPFCTVLEPGGEKSLTYAFHIV